MPPGQRMTMTQTNDASVRKLIRRYVRIVIFWTPILSGIAHQIAMTFFGVDRIYVFVKPPEYIEPWATLEFQWWIVLTLMSSILYLLISARRFPTIPTRVAVPFYLYLLFLLILIKPI